MAKKTPISFGNMFNEILYDEQVIEQFDEFSKKYKDKEDEEIYSEIDRLQKEVSEEIKKKHLKNLELLSQIEGFTTQETVREVENVKKLLKIKNSSENKKVSEREIRRQYVSPSSLLLWFLLLTVIYRGRKRYYRRSIFGNFRPY